MNEKEKYLKSIRRTAAVGLGVAGMAVLAAALFTYASKYRFYANNYTTRMMLILGSVGTVLVVGGVLHSIRRKTPTIRQTDTIQERLRLYDKHMKGVYFWTMGTVVAVCAMAVLSAQNVLLMLAIVATLTLFLAYPNMYKIQVDLGLTDEEMKELFGKAFIKKEEDAKG